jgi:uncharacterized protein YidB (DUF937 family)
MGLLDNIFGGGSGSAVPGGNVTKPLMIALLALLASRYMSGSRKAPDAESVPTSPGGADEISPGSVVGGLGGLLKQFQDAGFGDIAKSWIGTGPNEPAAPRDIADALGPDMIDALSQRTGLPREQVTAILSQVLPQAVDKLTPHGRLPTQEELARTA